MKIVVTQQHQQVSCHYYTNSTVLEVEQNNKKQSILPKRFEQFLSGTTGFTQEYLQHKRKVSVFTQPLPLSSRPVDLTTKTTFLSVTATSHSKTFITEMLLELFALFDFYCIFRH